MHWAWRGLAAAGAAAEIALLAWLWLGPALAVHSIQVSGSRHLSASQVALVAGLQGNGSVPSVDDTAARQKLEAQVWVRSATAQAQLPGTAIVQDTCQNSAGQNWYFFGDPANGNPFQLKNIDTGLCADIQSFSNGAPLVQVPCGQQQIGAYWKYVPAGSREFPFTNLFRLQSPFANYCLDLENGERTIGLPMQVWQCNPNTNNQVWYFF